MSEDTSTNQGNGGTAGTATSVGDPKADGSSATATTAQAGKVNPDGITTDKNKSPEKYVEEAEKKYIIPSLVREKFPDLVKLIYETESMNQEEREYWMQIMPIMTEDQIKKFRDILVNEKEQLLRLDQQYQSQMSSLNKPVKEINEEEMKKKIDEIKQAEQAHQKTEASKEEDILNQLENL